MVTKIHGGIINQQMLTGSVRYFTVSVDGGTTEFDNTIGDAGALAVAATVVSSGDGAYVHTDVLTVVGGSGGTAPTITIADQTPATGPVRPSVINGTITLFTISSPGSRTTIPANPVSVTGGTGTGATFNIDWSSTIIIPNAELGTGGPEFYVGYNKPVPGSAVDQILGVISERADIVQVAVTSGTLLQVAVANTGFAWDENDDGNAAAEMQTAIRALGAAVVVPDTTDSGTTVDLSSVDVVEKFFNNGIAP